MRAGSTNHGTPQPIGLTSDGEVWSVRWLALVGLAGTAIGLFLIQDTLSFDAGGALAGITSQLSVTLPAAVGVAFVGIANLLAGSVLMRLLTGRPFGSLSELVLGGFVGAVLLDVALLYLLGGIGLFVGPVLLAIHAGLLVLGWRARPIVKGSMPSARPLLSLLGVFIVVAWSAPVLLQLASPVVPFIDVLPNHVAPVEHLRAFGSFDPLTTTPSPIYGPSRTSLGYVALLGVVAVVTDLPAGLAVSAFIVVEVVLVAVAVYRLATTVGGPRAGVWMLVTFTLTQSFARLADDRARVLVLPLAAWTLAEFVRATRDPAAGEPGDMKGELRRLVPLAAALGATIMVHAVIGAFTAGTILVLSLIRPRRHLDLGLATVGVATVIALPQAASMVGYALPPAAGLATVPLAAATAVVLNLAAIRRAARLIVWIGLAGIALFAAWHVVLVAIAAGLWGGEFAASLPTLAAMALVGLVVARRQVFPPVIWAALLVGALAGTAALAIPADNSSLLFLSLRFEVPKEVHSWAPVFLALAAAIAIAALLAPESSSAPPKPRSRRRRLFYLLIVSAFLVAATMPIRLEPIGPFHVGEHRVSENLAIHLRHAERGFWVRYADPRLVVDEEQREILGVVGGYVSTGQIGADTELLHVARTYQQWGAIPIGVFTGVRETVVSVETEASIHTVGGHLRPMTQLDALLASSSPRFDYVVLEPDGLRADVRERIIAAGYRSVFKNARGELFTQEDR